MPARRLAACEPTRLDVRHATIDAGPLPETLLVEPRDGGCIIVSFQDHSGDGFKGDYGDLIHAECADIDSECGFADVMGCEVVAEYYLD
jgi:hypothetical protein